MNLTIGCDPELLLYDTKKARLVPANGLIPGTKESPHQLSQGTVQIDGTLIEIGTNPASSYEEWEDNLQVTLREVNDIINPNGSKRFIISTGDIASYDPRDLKGIPESVFEIGCDPQYALFGDGSMYVVQPNAHTLSPDAVPAGGHIHIGLEGHGCDPSSDKFLISMKRLYSNAIFNIGEKDLGKSDRHRDRIFRVSRHPVRVKPYGFEARVFTNWWVSSPAARKTFFEYVAYKVDNRLETNRQVYDKLYGLWCKNKNSRTKIPLIGG